MHLTHTSQFLPMLNITALGALEKYGVESSCTKLSHDASAVT